MAQHAKFSASSSHRWMSCAASISMSQGVESTSSVYAREGTAAHSLGEACLRSGESPFDHLDEEIIVEGDTFAIDEGMAEAVQTYIETVLADYDPKTDVLAVEQRFDLSRFHPDMFGTCDAVIYKPIEKKLIVYDYKHGRGYAVEADNNSQMKFYGLGAALVENRPLDVVELVIVQPRAQHPKGPVRRWSTDVMTLVDFSADIVAAAKAALSPNPLIVAGEHCTFCPAAGFCPELRERSLSIANATFAAHPLADWAPPPPESLTREQRAAVMERAEALKDWIGAVQQYEHGLAEGGDVMPGWKLVDKRATRKWLDPETVKTDLLGFKNLRVTDIYLEPKLKSPAQMEAAILSRAKEAGEKLTKEAAGKVLAPFVSKESSGTNLVRDADARPEVKAAVMNAFTKIPPMTDIKDVFA